MTYADLREALHDVLAEDVSGRPRLYQILRSLAIEAQAGNVRAAALLLDRAFGAPQITTPDAQQRTIIYLDGPPSDTDRIERSAEAGAEVAERQHD